jgi:threonine synthase
MNEFYKSTRGKEVGLNFEEAVLRGLASDKGLFVPKIIPTFSNNEIEEVGQNHHNIKSISHFFQFRTLSFTDLAYEITRRFISEDNIPNSDLRLIVEKSFSTNFQSSGIV